MSGELPADKSCKEKEYEKWDTLDSYLCGQIAPHLKEYLNQDRLNIEVAFDDIFRQSFKFSNGSPTLQALLQIQALKLLGQRGDCGDLDTIGDVALGSTLDMDKFLPPRQHVRGKPMDRWQKRLPAIWDLYVDLAVNLSDLTCVEPQDKVGAKSLGAISIFGSTSIKMLAWGTTYRIAKAEQRYMDRGRPERAEASRYKSHLQHHGVQGMPTGNAEFDFILAHSGVIIDIVSNTKQDDAPQHWVFRRTTEEVAKLSEMWETRHPGQSFKGLEGQTMQH